MSRGWVKRTDALMDIARNEQAAEADPAANLRRHGRVVPNTATCNLGKILDLSASGIRLRSKRPLVGEMVVEIKGDDQAIRVLGQVVWGRKLGFRAYEIGMKFVNIPAEAQALIQRVAAL